MLDKKAVLTREKIKRNMHDRKTFFYIVIKVTVSLIVFIKITVFYN